MTDVDVRIPAVVRDRLAELAAAEGVSLRAYLIRLAGVESDPPSAQEQAMKARTARELLFRLNGYNPTPEEERELDAELRRRMGQDAR